MWNFRKYILYLKITGPIVFKIAPKTCVAFKAAELWKLDGVGPVDNRPFTNKLHQYVREKKEEKNCDMWYVTRDVTCDTWHVTCLGGWAFSKNFSSLALTVCDLWYYEDLEEKDDLIN